MYFVIFLLSLYHLINIIFSLQMYKKLDASHSIGSSYALHNHYVKFDFLPCSSHTNPNPGKIRSGDNASRPNSRTRSPSMAQPSVPAPTNDTEGHEDVPPPREPTPVPEQTIFMQVVDFLLEYKAMPVSTYHGLVVSPLFRPCI